MNPKNHELIKFLTCLIGVEKNAQICQEHDENNIKIKTRLGQKHDEDKIRVKQDEDKNMMRTI